MMARSTHLIQVLAFLILICIQAAASSAIFQPPSSQCSLRNQSRSSKGSIGLSACPLAFQFQSKQHHHHISSHVDSPRLQTNTHRIFRYTNHPRNIQTKLLLHHSNINDSQKTTSPSSQSTLSNEQSRRTILLNLLTLTTITQLPSSTIAASQIDATGELYSPKSEMLSRGGSAAARGIKLPKKERDNGNKGGDLLKNKSGLIQDVYETRFVAYLTRFLLNFDPAAGAWWKVCMVVLLC